MSKRLQVILDDDELAAIQTAARRRRITVSEYVRLILREARQAEPATPAERKLMLVREAAAHTYPISDPEKIEEEIARGYSDES
jgi:hypothetical protein